MKNIFKIFKNRQESKETSPDLMHNAKTQLEFLFGETNNYHLEVVKPGESYTGAVILTNEDMIIIADEDNKFIVTEPIMSNLKELPKLNEQITFTTSTKEQPENRTRNGAEWDLSNVVSAEDIIGKNQLHLLLGNKTPLPPERVKPGENYTGTVVAANADFIVIKDELDDLYFAEPATTSLKELPKLDEQITFTAPPKEQPKNKNTNETNKNEVDNTPGPTP